MAIVSGYKEVEQTTGTASAAKQEAPREPKKIKIEPEMTGNTTEVIGLTSIDMLGYEDSSFNEYLNKYVETSVETVKDSNLKITIFKLDKEKFSLPFSYVLYANKANNGVVYYFAAVLERTGREPVELHYIVDELKNAFNKPGNSDTMLVTADAFDATKTVIFEGVLKSNFNATGVKSLETIVVPTEPAVELVANSVSRLAHDVILTAEKKDLGLGTDITFDAIKQHMGAGNLNIDLTYSSGSTINKLGKPVFTDFILESNIGTGGTVRGFENAGNKRIALATGYVDYYLSEDTNMYTGAVTKKAGPLVILNEFIGRAPTLNYLLISIVNAYVLNKQNNMKNLLINVDAGPLNYYFNHGGDATKVGERLSFKDPKLPAEMLNGILEHNFIPMPVFNIEIEISGPDYTYAAAFTDLNKPEVGHFANKEIMVAAEQLIGAKLPDMNVAYNEGLIVPLGTFTGSDGEVRDIREINAAFIAANIQDPNILYEWACSNLPTSECMAITNKNPYIIKLEVLDKLAVIVGISPKITGKAVRIPINPQFIESLVNGASAKGYSPKIVVPNMYTEGAINLQSISNVYANAYTANVSFGNTGGNQGYTQNIHMNHSNRYN